MRDEHISRERTEQQGRLLCLEISKPGLNQREELVKIVHPNLAWGTEQKVLLESFEMLTFKTVPRELFNNIIVRVA